MEIQLTTTALLERRTQAFPLPHAKCCHLVEGGGAHYKVITNQEVNPSCAWKDLDFL